MTNLTFLEEVTFEAPIGKKGDIFDMYLTCI